MENITQEADKKSAGAYQTECSDFKNMLPRAACGFLDKEETRQLLIHLKQCETCRKIRDLISKESEPIFGKFNEQIFPGWESK